MWAGAILLVCLAVQHLRKLLLLPTLLCRVSMHAPGQLAACTRHCSPGRAPSLVASLFWLSVVDKPLPNCYGLHLSQL